MANKIPLVIADFETQISGAISAGATSFTLASATDDDGNALAAGKYCFTINNGKSNKQYLMGQLNGTAVTSVVSVDRRGNETSGAASAARSGSPVIISDFATIQRVADILRGQETLDGDNPIVYDAEPTLSDRKELATVAYVLDNVAGGTVNFDNQIISSSDAIAGETIVAGDWVFFQTSDQEWYKADADTVAEVDNVEIGVALGAGSDGASITGGIQKTGVYTTSGLTAGDTYYIGNTAGAITNSAGTTKRVVGVALSSTKLLMSPVSLISLTSREKDALAGGGDFGTPSSTNKFITDDYLDDAARVVRTRLTSSLVPTPAFYQSYGISAADALDTNYNKALGSNSDGSVLYFILSGSADRLYRFERDSVTGQYLETNTVTVGASYDPGTNTNGSIIVIGDYVYLFTAPSVGGNIVCARYDADDLANETEITVPTLASNNGTIVWTDGVNAYVVSSSTPTTSRLWTLSGTTFTASTTATITSPFTDISFWYSTFWDGTNAFICGWDGTNTAYIKKLTNITGTTVETTTKKMPTQSDLEGYGLGCNIDDERMYIGGFATIYDETGAISTRLELFPITKP